MPRKYASTSPQKAHIVLGMEIVARAHVQNPLTQMRLDQLQRRTSLKWRMHSPDVLPLWVAEMDVMLAEPVAAALHDAVDRGDTGYAAGTTYAESFASFAHERWGWDSVHPDRSAIVPDVMLGIVEVLRLLTRPGDAVVVTPPVYAPFYAFVEHADRRIEQAPLGAEDRVDLYILEDAFARAAATSSQPVFLMSNPHNPTGVVPTYDELSDVARLARQYGVRVIADEIHAALVLPGRTFTPYLTVPGSEDAFAITSATKAFNLAGLKAALVIAGTEAEADLARLPEEVSHGPSHLGMIAHTAAFRFGSPWLDSLLTGLDANRALLGELLRDHLPRVRYLPPEGTYLAWLDCRRLGVWDQAQTLDDQRAVVTDLSGPARHFLDHARVATTSGHVFGPGGVGHVRLNFATHPEILTEAVRRMGRAAGAGDG